MLKHLPIIFLVLKGFICEVTISVTDYNKFFIQDEVWGY